MRIGWLLGALLFTACDEPFEPFVTSGPELSVYGLLDASADTQWIRVTGVRQSVITAPEPPGAAVTLQRVGTTEMIEFRDSVFSYESTNLESSAGLHARNFWTDEPLIPGATYRLQVTRADAAPATAMVTIPEDADTVVVGVLRQGLGDYVRMVGVSHLATLDVLPGLTGCPSYQGGALSTHPDEDEEIVTSIVRHLVCLGTGRQPDTIRAWEIQMVFSGAAWPFDPNWTETEALIPGLASNVDGGLGFVGGVHRRTVPYELCVIIGADESDACELTYTHEPSTTIEGTVTEWTLGGLGQCLHGPQFGATVFLWETDRPDVDRVATVRDVRYQATISLREPDGVRVRSGLTDAAGSYWISALTPGLKYAIAVVDGHPWDHPPPDTVMVEAGQTLTWDIDLPGAPRCRV